MRIGLCNRMAKGWFEEFRDACTSLEFDFKIVEISNDDWMDQLHDLDIFVWRLIMSDPSCMAEARAKIPLIEEKGITCFPNSKMLWLYDDKIRETYFLRQNHYPVPKTWIFFEAKSAYSFLTDAVFPLVAKSHCGAGSSGVVVLRTHKEANKMLNRIFADLTLWDKVLEKYYYTPKLEKGDLLLYLQFRYHNSRPMYAYFQEFVTTEMDWRITTLGHDLVSVFVRKNRPDDFRASGSGLWKKVTEAELPIEACVLALEISNKHGFESMTYDFMEHQKRWVIGEVSYAFVLNPIYTETLFQREGATFKRIDPIPIGVMHLKALARSCTTIKQVGGNFD